MKNTISKRDWENISAYLDGQLSQRKQARLESRLQKDLQFRVAVEELRKTRHILRNAPRLRVPRDFMLTPEMGGNPIRLPQMAPIFGWISAVSSFLLVLFLIGDFFNSGGLIPIINSTPQLSDMVPQNREISEDRTLEQSGITQDSQNLQGVANDQTPPDNAKSLAPLEIAVEAEDESVTSQGTPTSEGEIVLFAAPQESLPEQAEDGFGIGEQGEAALAVTTETPSSVTVGESGEPKEATDTLQPSESIMEMAPVTETNDISAVLEDPSEQPLAEEAEQSVDEDSGQPAQLSTAISQESESTVQQEEQSIAEPKALQVEQSTADGSRDFQTATPTLWSSDLNPESTTATTSVSGQSRDLILGLEMILVLCSFAAGLAWIFLRQQGG